MTTARLTVACLGLGRIGAGIAQSIQPAGHRLIVYNRTPEKAQPFVASGAAIAHSPRDAAAQADVVLTCLMGDESVLENLVGENGILAGLRPDAIHIGTSTVTPKATAQFAKMHKDRDGHYLTATFRRSSRPCCGRKAYGLRRGRARRPGTCSASAGSVHSKDPGVGG